MIRVLVVDDEEMSRRGLSAALAEAPDITLVEHARVGIDALACLYALAPDVVVFNTGQHSEWIRIVGEILEAVPPPRTPRVIVVTGTDSGSLLLPAVRAGVAGVLLRSLSGDELTYAVRHVARGHCVLSPALTSHLIARLRNVPETRESVTGIDSLTPRERQVLAGLAAGMSNVEIAGEANLTVATVKTYVSNILTKLNVRDRVQAALVGQRARLGL